MKRSGGNEQSKLLPLSPDTFILAPVGCESRKHYPHITVRPPRLFSYQTMATPDCCFSLTWRKTAPSSCDLDDGSPTAVPSLMACQYSPSPGRSILVATSYTVKPRLLVPWLGLDWCRQTIEPAKGKGVEGEGGF